MQQGLYNDLLNTQRTGTSTPLILIISIVFIDSYNCYYCITLRQVAIHKFTNKR